MEYGLVLLWLATYLALGLTALPVAAVLFRRFPDRGAGVALPLALVVVTVPAYWIGHLAFGWPALLVGLAALVGTAVAAVKFTDAEPRWNVAGETAAVFAVAFLLVVAIRAADPFIAPLPLSAGEKFLDHGMLQTILRAETLPPEDFWYAGEPVQYYYGGHLIAALLTMLTWTAPDYAYNLALAGFYGMLVAAAFGIGGTLAAARGGSRRLGGVLAAFLVGIASNLETAARVFVWLLPDSLAEGVIGATGLSDDLTGWTPDHFWYWDASRVITDSNGVGTNEPPTEFPLFAWLNGDLHAHMMSQPFELLVVALLLAYVLTPESEVRRRLGLLGFVAVVGGLQAFLHTWSFPAVAGLTVLTVYFAPSDPRSLLPGNEPGRRDDAPAEDEQAARPQADGGETGDDEPGRTEHAEDTKRAGETGDLWGKIIRREGLRGATAFGVSVVVGVVGLLLALPFFTESASTRDVALVDASIRTGLGEQLLVHGAFVAIFAAFLGVRFLDWAYEDDDPRDRAINAGLLLAAGLAFVAATTVAGMAVVGLLVPLFVVGWLLLRSENADFDFGLCDDSTGTGESGSSDGVGFETVLLIAGVGLVMLVEFIHVVEDAGPGRFNTVFKTYAQVWVLWGTAAGAVLATMVGPHLAGLRAALFDGRLRTDANSIAGSVAVVFAALLLVTSVALYGGFALSGHLGSPAAENQPHGQTLNGTAYVEHEYPEEAAAIRWLDDQKDGTTIVSAAPGTYTWDPADGEGASAAASLTGQPTVLGWHHQIGYRGFGPYEDRLEDVEAIYTGEDELRACLLSTYDVDYVYVGPAEENRYDERTLEGAAGLDEPIQHGEVLLYPVDGDEVAEYDNSC